MLPHAAVDLWTPEKFTQTSFSLVEKSRRAFSFLPYTLVTLWLLTFFMKNCGQHMGNKTVKQTIKTEHQ